jgi:hypothetical protein
MQVWMICDCAEPQEGRAITKIASAATICRNPRECAFSYPSLVDLAIAAPSPCPHNSDQQPQPRLKDTDCPHLAAARFLPAISQAVRLQETLDRALLER